MEAPPPPPPPPTTYELETPMQGFHSSSSSSGGSPCPHPSAVMMKRKRTQRQRASLPASSSASSLEDFSFGVTEEEEDMAHCLILLAQGRARDSGGGTGTGTKFVSRKFTETTTTAGGKAGYYVYECKTCNKCFPSFQALGGHRASHKKPKTAAAAAALLPNVVGDHQVLALTYHHDHHHQDHHSPVLDTGSDKAFAKRSPTGNKLRVHECSICGAEFSSGQALGGHMRRHRPIVQASTEPPAAQPVMLKKERDSNNVLSLDLDLNLPAPSDEMINSNADQFSMVFSATSALVDCHY